MSVSNIDVKDKNVIVIGGGDTGTDCVATSIRMGCKSLVQFEIMPKPADKTLSHDGWLSRVRTHQMDYGQYEAAALFGSDPREYSVLTKKFVADTNGNLTGLETVEVVCEDGKLIEVEHTEKFWNAETVFLAMGFVGGEDNTFFEQLGITITDRNTIAVNENKQTKADKVFAAGDCERGQSLIVWAIADGRKAAAAVHTFLVEQPQNAFILSAQS